MNHDLLYFFKFILFLFLNVRNDSRYNFLFVTIKQILKLFFMKNYWETK